MKIKIWRSHKIKIKISHRYCINRPSSRHGHKYSKYKKCLSIKQHKYNIWSPIHEKVNGMERNGTEVANGSVL